MFGGSNGNTVLPVFLEESRLQYQTNASNQLQLFNHIPAGCGVDPINYIGNEHVSSMLRPNKRGREPEDVSRHQKLQISLNTNICKDEVDLSARIRNPNPVSTGLRLSYDDDEPNSSVTSASGSMAVAPPIILSLGDNIRTELDRQKEEFDKFILVQEEQLMRGVRDMKQRHMTSFLSAMERGVSQKLREKDLEIENINHKNKELIERVKQVSMEAQTWHHRAINSENMVNTLKSNLQQAIAQGADRVKEGFGDSEIDDAASYVDPNNRLNTPYGNTKSVVRNSQGMKDQITCKACKVKEVCMLLMPCRHLCLCEDCDPLISFCPVCQLMKSGSVQVFRS